MTGDPRFRLHPDGSWAVSYTFDVWTVHDGQGKPMGGIGTEGVHTPGWSEAALIPVGREALADHIASAFARICPMWVDPDGPAIAWVAADAVLRLAGDAR